MELVGYIAAILMGLSLGLIGGGGSILTVPILVYFFGQDPLSATTNSLFIVGFTALLGAAIYARQGFVDYKNGLIFVLPSFVGVYFARNLILPGIPETIFSLSGMALSKSLLVLLSFATLMILASVSMIKSGGSLTTEKVDRSVGEVALRGVFVGAVTGFVGAGGGFLIIPALVVLLGLTMRRAVGTSLMIITLNSLFGFLISHGRSETDWTFLLSITLLGALGLVAGRLLSSRIDERRLKVGFGFFVFVVGASIVLGQLFV